MFSSLFVQTGPASGGWTIYPPLSALGDASDGSKTGMDLWLDQYGIVYCFFIAGRLKLYHYYLEHAYKRNEHDEVATYHLGIFLYSSFRCTYLSRYYYQRLYLLLFDRHLGTSFYLSDIYINGKILPNEGGALSCSSIYSGSWVTLKYILLLYRQWELFQR